jgi:hypothetical protein
MGGNGSIEWIALDSIQISGTHPQGFKCLRGVWDLKIFS